MNEQDIKIAMEDSSAADIIQELYELVLLARTLILVSQPPKGIIARLDWETARKEFLDGVPK